MINDLLFLKMRKLSNSFKIQDVGYNTFYLNFNWDMGYFIKYRVIMSRLGTINVIRND